MMVARRLVFLAVLGAALVVWAVGCGAAGGGGDQGGGTTVKMVSDLPLQGSSRGQTVTMVNAIELALKQRDNKAGKINIEYESLDDATAQAGQWDPAKCAENARRAAQDEEVVGWIGPFNSGCAVEQIPILNEAGLAMVSPANTYIGLTKPSPDETEPDKYYPTGERNYTRVIPADDKQGRAGAVLMKEEGIESVYILDDRQVYGVGLADEFEKSVREEGIDVLGRQGIDGKAANYRSLMNRIDQADPDAIYYGGITQNNVGQLIKDKIGAGMSNEDVFFLGPDGIFEDAFLEAAGEAGEGAYITFGGLPIDELPPKGQKFVEQYEKQYPDEPIQGYTAYAYEAANVMLDAIARAGEDGEVEREEVIEELFATEDYNGVLGTWSFDEDGDTSLTEYTAYEVEDGDFKLYKTGIDVSE